MDFTLFGHQIELILRDRNLLLQAAFDLFDINSDEKISELDLFKTFFLLEKLPPGEYGSDILKDICQMRKPLQENWGRKMQKIVAENQGNYQLINRVHYWRNLQILDKKFDKKK